MFRTASHTYRQRRLFLAAIIATVAVAACADGPTQPASDALSLRPRRTDYICVRPGTATTPPDTVAPDENGQCLVGFEILPWG
jgi:hypothetical protein